MIWGNFLGSLGYWIINNIVSCRNVQECLSIGVLVDSLQHWEQALANLGQEQYSYLNPVQNGHIKRLTDQDIQSSVLEIMGTNVTTAFITCPVNSE